MACVVGYLGEERALSPPVALAEGVQRVDIAQQLCELADESFSRQATEPVSGTLDCDLLRIK
jgi:hypothetical protein